MLATLAAIRSHDRRRRGGLWVASVAATCLALLLAPSVLALGATVTRGDIHSFAAGTGLGISGRAEMVRTPDGRTIVTVHVEGLNPDTTYGSHVHQLPCGTSA